MCWLFCVSVLFFTLTTSDSTLLDKLSKIKWHCADENCSVPISEGYGLRLYNGDDPLKLNFNANDQFLILGKTNDDKFDNYWLVQTGDRKGIVPVQFVKERKVIINKGEQIITELDLSSIIQPVQTERTIKEAIKPSPPKVVVDGTTLPSYEDEPSDVVVEEESEEVYESSIPLEKENLVFGTSGFSDTSSIKNDSPETDGNQQTNHSGTSEGFVGDKVASIVSHNVDITEGANSDIENGTTPEISGIVASQNFANDVVETVHC
ncbi:unnamed protein product [Nezara viridula]|uniref:SH3 domain-containing protein n=1 Tax=Nezara viridula TaxID=85310 RepID=A0A9P0HTC7_NEZVI|nr:unnamed protein product [Nezara viridula]